MGFSPFCLNSFILIEVRHLKQEKSLQHNFFPDGENFLVNIQQHCRNGCQAQYHYSMQYIERTARAWWLFNGCSQKISALANQARSPGLWKAFIFFVFPSHSAPMWLLHTSDGKYSKSKRFSIAVCLQAITIAFSIYGKEKESSQMRGAMGFLNFASETITNGFL